MITKSQIFSLCLRTVVTELNCHGLSFKNTLSSSPFLLKQGIFLRTNLGFSCIAA